MNNICVVGSVYWDIQNVTEKHFGGKGLNQAIAAARLGSSIEFVASCHEIDKSKLEEMLLREGIFCKIFEVREQTGVRFFEQKADRYFHEYKSGANHFLPQKEAVLSCSGEKPADLFLSSIEMPGKTVKEIFSYGKTKRRFTVLNASCLPKDGWEEILPYTDLFVASKRELAFLFSENQNDGMQKVIDLGAKYCLVTDGACPTHLFDGVRMIQQEIPICSGTDTWGIGDVFVGALCHRLALIQYIDFGILQNQVGYAIKASQKAMLRKGRQEKFPYMIELMDFLKY